jgi:hypothetical protein
LFIPTKLVVSAGKKQSPGSGWLQEYDGGAVEVGAAVVVVVGATVVVVVGATVVVVVGRGQLTVSDSVLTSVVVIRALPAAHDTAVELPGGNELMDVAPIAAPIPKNKTAVAAKTAMAVVSCFVTWFFTIRHGQECAQMLRSSKPFSSSSRSLRTSPMTFAADRSIGAPPCFV